MKTLSKDKLPAFLAALQAEYAVYVPAETGKNSRFVPYGEGVIPKLGYNTYLSPKDVFFPHTEKMYKFKTQGMNLEIEPVELPVKGRILFGIRSCDAAGVDCLDRVFLEGQFEDTYYKARREESLLFALACAEHSEACFCPSLGIDPQKADNADVQMYDCGDSYALESKTDAGAAVLEKYAQFFTETANPAIKETAPFSIAVDVAGISDKLETMFEHPLWEDIAGKCIGCSTCSYVCPTCYCFDIANRNVGEEGIKIRCWDFCMADDYALMAGGHDPRPAKSNRVRNRFMDKLLYNVKRHGRLYCVGCGRCVLRCPVNLEITTVIRRVKEAEVE